MNQTDLSIRLAEARKNTGYTQSEVAEKLNVSIQTISAWERGMASPEIDKLPSLAQMYNVTTDWILLGKLPTKEILEVTSNLSDRLFSEERMSTYVGAFCNAKQLYQTRKALDFAWEKHDGMYRKQGHGSEKVPYIYHPLLLTCHALALGLEEDDLLATCLLHDVCEDCGVAVEDLPVGDIAKEAVELLTKPKSFTKTDDAQQSYYGSISQNRIAIIVKLLDRCNNISSMATSFSDEKIAKYIKETEQYVTPLMDVARKEYPQYANQLFLIRYHMNSVLEALKHHMKNSL